MISSKGPVHITPRWGWTFRRSSPISSTFRPPRRCWLGGDLPLRLSKRSVIELSEKQVALDKYLLAFRGVHFILGQYLTHA